MADMINMNMNTGLKGASIYAGQLIEFHTELYQQALQAGDRRSMSESAGILSVAYAVQGNAILARKWAESFFADLPVATAGAAPTN